MYALHRECAPTLCVYASRVYTYTLSVCVTWLYVEIDTHVTYTLKVSVYTLRVYLNFVCMHIFTLWVYVSLDCTRKLTQKWLIHSKWLYTYTLSVSILSWLYTHTLCVCITCIYLHFECMRYAYAGTQKSTQQWRIPSKCMCTHWGYTYTLSVCITCIYMHFECMRYAYTMMYALKLYVHTHCVYIHFVCTRHCVSFSLHIWHWWQTLKLYVYTHCVYIHFECTVCQFPCIYDTDDINLNCFYILIVYTYTLSVRVSVCQFTCIYDIDERALNTLYWHGIWCMMYIHTLWVYTSLYVFFFIYMTLMKGHYIHCVDTENGCICVYMYIYVYTYIYT